MQTNTVKQLGWICSFNPIIKHDKLIIVNSITKSLFILKLIYWTHYYYDSTKNKIIFFIQKIYFNKDQIFTVFKVVPFPCEYRKILIFENFVKHYAFEVAVN